MALCQGAAGLFFFSQKKQLPASGEATMEGGYIERVFAD